MSSVGIASTELFPTPVSALKRLPQPLAGCLNALCYPKHSDHLGGWLISTTDQTIMHVSGTEWPSVISSFTMLSLDDVISSHDQICPPPFISKDLLLDSIAHIEERNFVEACFDCMPESERCAHGWSAYEKHLLIRGCMELCKSSVSINRGQRAQNVTLQKMVEQSLGFLSAVQFGMMVRKGTVVMWPHWTSWVAKSGRLSSMLPVQVTSFHQTLFTILNQSHTPSPFLLNYKCPQVEFNSDSWCQKITDRTHVIEAVGLNHPQYDNIVAELLAHRVGATQPAPQQTDEEQAAVKMSLSTSPAHINATLFLKLLHSDESCRSGDVIDMFYKYWTHIRSKLPSLANMRYRDLRRWVAIFFRQDLHFQCTGDFATKTQDALSVFDIARKKSHNALCSSLTNYMFKKLSTIGETELQVQQVSRAAETWFMLIENFLGDPNSVASLRLCRTEFNLLQKIPPQLLFKTLVRTTLHQALDLMSTVNHNMNDGRRVSTQTDQEMMGRIRQISKMIPTTFSCLTYLNMCMTFLSQEASAYQPTVFKLFNRLRGRFFEDVVALGFPGLIQPEEADENLRSFIVRSHPSLGAKLSNVSMMFPSADGLRWSVTPTGFIVKVVELVFSSSWKRQRERIRERYQIVQRTLNAVGAEITIRLHVAGVDTTASSWAEQFATLESFLGEKMVPAQISLQTISEVLQHMKYISRVLIDRLPMVHQAKIKSGIEFAHMQMSSHVNCVVGEIAAWQLDEAVSNMINRQHDMKKNGIIPIHSDEFGPNDGNLSDVVCATGIFADELRSTINDADDQFLRDVADGVESFIATGRVASCNINANRIIPRNWFSISVQQAVKTDFVLLYICTRCKNKCIPSEWILDSTRSEHHGEQIWTNGKSETLSLASSWMRSVWSSRMTPVTPAAGCEMAAIMIAESTATPMSASDVSSMRDVLFRTPSALYRTSSTKLVTSMEQVAYSPNMVKAEHLRRHYSQSFMSTTVAAFCRRLQEHISAVQGSPVIVFDSSHVKINIKQPVLHDTLKKMTSSTSAELSIHFKEIYQRSIFKQSRMTDPDMVELVGGMAKSTGMKPSDVQDQILATADINTAINWKQVSTNALNNQSMWIAIDRFTKKSAKLKYMTEAMKQDELLLRSGNSKVKLSKPGLCFPYVKARQAWIATEMENLSRPLDLSTCKHQAGFAARAKAFFTPEWLNQSFESAMIASGRSDHGRGIRDQAINELLQRPGFLYAVHCADVATTINKLLHTKLGPSDIGIRKLKVSGLTLMCSMVARSEIKSTGIKVMLFGKPPTLDKRNLVGCHQTAWGKQSWSYVSADDLASSHCFHMDSRHIRQHIAAPAYLIDNYLSELQANCLLKPGPGNTVVINENKELQNQIKATQTSIWLTYILANRRPLSEMVQNQRFGMLTMAGIAWQHSELSKKISMKPFCSFDHFLLRQYTDSYNGKFGEEWCSRLLKLAAGSKRFFSMMMAGQISEEAVKEVSDEFDSFTNWRSPRLVGGGTHNSAWSALREIFQAYQYDRDITHYDAEMIKVGNKIEKGAAKAQANLSAKPFCDGKPWGLWAARGYTLTDNDRHGPAESDADRPRRNSATTLDFNSWADAEEAWELESARHTDPGAPSFDPDLEAELAVKLAIRTVPLPGFSRRSVCIGTRLMREAHPEGLNVTDNWQARGDLTKSLVERANTSSAVEKIVTKINIDETTKKKVQIEATKLAKLAQFTEKQHLSAILVNRGFDIDLADIVADETLDVKGKQKVTEQDADSLIAYLSDIFERPMQPSEHAWGDSINEKAVRMLKAATVHRKTEMVSLARMAIDSLFNESCEAVLTDELCKKLSNAWKDVESRMAANNPLSKVFLPLLGWHNETCEALSPEWWSNVKCVVHILMAATTLPSELKLHTKAHPSRIKATDVNRVMTSNRDISWNAVRLCLPTNRLPPAILDYMLWTIGLEADVTTSLNDLCSAHTKTKAGVQMTSEQMTRSLMTATSLHLHRNPEITSKVSNATLLASIQYRPLKYLLSRLSIKKKVAKIKMPGSTRKKKVLSVAEQLAHTSFQGLVGGANQLERGLAAALSLQHFFYARAAKQQVGGSREIPVKDLLTNEATTVAEIVDNAINSYFVAEAVSHPYQKKTFQDRLVNFTTQAYKTIRSASMKVRVITCGKISMSMHDDGIQIELMRSLMQSISANGLLDHSSWGPGHSTSMFTASGNVFTSSLGRTVSQMKRLIDEKLCQQNDEIPAAIWTRWLRKDFNKAKLPGPMIPVFERFRSSGHIVRERPFDMGQGMRHAGSSTPGIASGYMRRSVMRQILARHGFNVEMRDQQGSDDRGSGALLTYHNEHVGSCEYPQIIQSLACMMKAAEHEGSVDTILANRTHRIQRGVEQWYMMLDCMLSRCSNQKISPKSVWSRTISEMNSRFIVGRRVISPVIRDTAVLCQGPPGGSLSECALSLFSSAKNAMACGASELIVTPLYLYHIARLADKFMFNPDEDNNHMIRIANSLRSSSHSGITIFDLPISLGGFFLPTNDYLLFSSTFEADRHCIRRLLADWSPSSKFILMICCGLVCDNRSQLNEAMMLHGNSRASQQVTMVPQFRVKRSILQPSARASAQLSDLLEECSQSLISQAQAEDGITPEIRNAILLVSPYLTSRKTICDLQKIRRILKSPGLTRGINSLDYTHMQWVSYMCGSGHAHLLPFAAPDRQETSVLVMSDKKWLQQALGIDEARATGLCNMCNHWFDATRNSKPLNRQTRVVNQLGQFPPPKRKAEKKAYKFSRCIAETAARSMQYFGAIALDIAGRVKNAFFKKECMSLLGVKQVTMTNMTTSDRAIASRVLPTNHVETVRFPAFSDGHLNPLHGQLKIANPPMLIAILDTVPQALVQCGTVVPKMADAHGDIALIKTHAAEEYAILCSILTSVMRSGLTDKSEGEFARAAVNLWKATVDLQPNSITALVPVAKHWTNRKRVNRSFKRTIIHGFEFSSIAELPGIETAQVNQQLQFIVNRTRESVNSMKELARCVAHLSGGPNEFLQLCKTVGTRCRHMLLSNEKCFADCARPPRNEGLSTHPLGRKLLAQHNALRWLFGYKVIPHRVHSLASTAVNVRSCQRMNLASSEPNKKDVTMTITVLSCENTLMVHTMRNLTSEFLLMNPTTSNINIMLQKLTRTLAGRYAPKSADIVKLSESLFKEAPTDMGLGYVLKAGREVRHGKIRKGDKYLPTAVSTTTKLKMPWFHAVTNPELTQFEFDSSTMSIVLTSPRWGLSSTTHMPMEFDEVATFDDVADSILKDMLKISGGEEWAPATRRMIERLRGGIKDTRVRHSIITVGARCSPRQIARLAASLGKGDVLAPCLQQWIPFGEFARPGKLLITTDPAAAHRILSQGLATMSLFAPFGGLMTEQSTRLYGDAGADDVDHAQQIIESVNLQSELLSAVEESCNGTSDEPLLTSLATSASNISAPDHVKQLSGILHERVRTGITRQKIADGELPNQRKWTAIKYERLNVNKAATLESSIAIHAPDLRLQALAAVAIGGRTGLSTAMSALIKAHEVDSATIEEASMMASGARMIAQQFNAALIDTVTHHSAPMTNVKAEPMIALSSSGCMTSEQMMDPTAIRKLLDLQAPGQVLTFMLMKFPNIKQEHILLGTFMACCRCSNKDRAGLLELLELFDPDMTGSSETEVDFQQNPFAGVAIGMLAKVTLGLLLSLSQTTHHEVQGPRTIMTMTMFDGNTIRSILNAGKHVFSLEFAAPTPPSSVKNRLYILSRQANSKMYNETPIASQVQRDLDHICATAEIILNTMDYRSMVAHMQSAT